eukprot:364547-Chlamydomonas_euryale.AAC.10
MVWTSQTSYSVDFTRVAWTRQGLEHRPPWTPASARAALKARAPARSQAHAGLLRLGRTLPAQGFCRRCGCESATNPQTQRKSSPGPLPHSIKTGLRRLGLVGRSLLEGSVRSS